MNDAIGPAVAALATAAGSVSALVAGARDPAVRRFLAARASALDSRLDYLQTARRGRAIVAAQGALLALLVGCALLGSGPAPLALAPAVLMLPAGLLHGAAARRTTRIEAQLDAWLLSLAHALKAQPALGAALAQSARRVDGPLAQELTLVLKSHRLGTPLDQALSEMSARIGSAVVHGALVTLRVARNTGGDVGVTLETAAATLREMARLEGVVRTKTAEGRAQATLIAAIPGALYLGLDALDPNFLRPLEDTARGHAILALAGTIWLAAVVWARRIVAVEV